MNVNNIERHATATALTVGATTLVAISGVFGYWMLQRTTPLWEKALAASISVVGSLGVASYVGSTGSRVWGKYQTTYEMSDQVEVQTTWNELTKPTAPTPPSSVPTMAKPDGLPEIGWNDVIKEYINKPELHPHMGVFGNTGSGKTLLAEVLGDLRAQYYREKGKEPRQVYLSPTCDKSQQEFLGWELVGDGFNSSSIETFGSELAQTLYDRYTEEEPGAQPIITATDEYRWTAQKTESVTDAVGDVLSIGRKRELEIVMIAPNYLVKTLKMEGEGQLRSQMSMFLKGSLVTDRLSVLERDELVPKGTVKYVSRLLEKHPYNVCLCDDKLLILPDMSEYRQAKVEMGYAYTNNELATLTAITPPSVSGVQKKGGGRRR